MQINKKLIRRIKLRNFIAQISLFLSLLATIFGLFWLIWILWTTVFSGINTLSFQIFTEHTPPPNTDEGGIGNALVGSLIMVFGATLIGAPIGILAGVYLSEYRQNNWLLSFMQNFLRLLNDILLSAPSIVIGLFVYAVMVTQMKSFSAIAGILALAIIQIPIIIRTTENILKLIPNYLREAAFALGAPKWWIIYKITMKAALAGIITGVLLSIARIAGETAPLLFTALNNQFWSFDLTQPMGNLPVMIFQFALSPYEYWQQLAWAGVFLITVGVLIVNIITRVISSKKY